MFVQSHDPKEIKLHRQLTWQARQLRKNPTAAECALWQCLRTRKLLNYKFRRQYALYGYIVDFYCHELKLIIEVDGDVHDTTQLYDSTRDRVLSEFGYITIRFNNNQVIHEIDYVMLEIAQLLDRRGRAQRAGGGTDLCSESKHSPQGSGD